MNQFASLFCLKHSSVLRLISTKLIMISLNLNNLVPACTSDPTSLPNQEVFQVLGSSSCLVYSYLYPKFQMATSFSSSWLHIKYHFLRDRIFSNYPSKTISVILNNITLSYHLYCTCMNLLVHVLVYWFIVSTMSLGWELPESKQWILSA